MCEFQLRFESLYHPGRGFTFPCDNNSKVDMAAMSSSEIDSFNTVSELAGIEYSYPIKEPKLTK